MNENYVKIKYKLAISHIIHFYEVGYDIKNTLWDLATFTFVRPFTNFQFRPIFKKMNKKVTDFVCQYKSASSNFIHSYEDWTILKISSEI